MHVDRVGKNKRIVEYDADRGIGAEVVDVPFGVVGVRIIALVGEEQDGVVVVGAERNAVHFPEKEECLIDEQRDIDGCGGGRIRVGGNGVPGYSFAERILGGG